MAFPIIASVSALGGIWAQNQQSKAIKKAANQMRMAQEASAQKIFDLARPYLEEGKWALPQIRRLVQQELVPKIGKDSPLLEAATQETIRGIERQGRAAIAESERYWQKSGVEGRARGETMRARMSMSEAKGTSLLKNAMGQEQYKQQNLSNALSQLGDLNRLGIMGTELASKSEMLKGQGNVQAAELEGQAESQKWGAIGGLFGMGLDYGLTQMQQQASKKASGTPDINPTSGPDIYGPPLESQMPGYTVDTTVRGPGPKGWIGIGNIDTEAGVTYGLPNGPSIQTTFAPAGGKSTIGSDRLDRGYMVPLGAATGITGRTPLLQTPAKAPLTTTTTTMYPGMAGGLPMLLGQMGIGAYNAQLRATQEQKRKSFSNKR